MQPYTMEAYIVHDKEYSLARVVLAYSVVIRSSSSLSMFSPNYVPFMPLLLTVENSRKLYNLSAVYGLRILRRRAPPLSPAALLAAYAFLFERCILLFNSLKAFSS